jgi:predicted DNA-binding ribbon-helix-helix protein
MSDPDSVRGPDPGAQIKKRSVVIAGHKTSVSLETAFWGALKRIAAARGSTVNELVEAIDGQRAGNLSSAIRVFVLRAANPTA